MEQKQFGQAFVRFNKLKPSRQYGVTIFIVTLLVVIWLWTYYLQIRTHINRAQQEIQTLKQQQILLEKTTLTNKELKNSLFLLEDSLTKLTAPKSKNKNNTYADRMANIANIAQKSGLQLQSCHTQNKKEKTWLCKQNIFYSTVGSNNQINHFIKALLTNEQAVKCRRLAFNKEENSKGRFECTLQLLNFENQNE